MSQEMKMFKSFFFAHRPILFQSGSIYVKPRPNWSSTHSTHIVEYISPAEMLRFGDIFVCNNYPGGCRVSWWPPGCVPICSTLYQTAVAKLPHTMWSVEQMLYFSSCYILIKSVCAADAWSVC